MPMPDITDQLRAHATWVDAGHRVPDPGDLRGRALAPGAALDLPRPNGRAGGRTVRLLAAAAVVVLVAGIGTRVRAGAGDPVSVGGPSAPDPSAGPLPEADGLVRAGSLPPDEWATGSQGLDYRDPTWQFGAYRPEDAERRVLTRDAAIAAARRGSPDWLAAGSWGSARFGHLLEIDNELGTRGDGRLVGDTPAWLITVEGVPDPPGYPQSPCPMARRACSLQYGAPGTASVALDAATGDVAVVYRWAPLGG
jgi:hypothetical protein